MKKTFGFDMIESAHRSKTFLSWERFQYPKKVNVSFGIFGDVYWFLAVNIVECLNFLRIIIFLNSQPHKSFYEKDTQWGLNYLTKIH